MTVVAVVAAISLTFSFLASGSHTAGRGGVGEHVLVVSTSQLFQQSTNAAILPQVGKICSRDVGALAYAKEKNSCRAHRGSSLGCQTTLPGEPLPVVHLGRPSRVSSRSAGEGYQSLVRDARRCASGGTLDRDACSAMVREDLRTVSPRGACCMECVLWPGRCWHRQWCV